LLSAVASGAAKIEAYEMDLNRAGQAARRLIVHAQRLVYLDLEHLRILMAVSDVTDARANEKLKDDALRQNHVLLQEVRHRVANSLQIIASVLLQNAKRTRSNETRGHLKDAHHRVMAIATLERQLAGSGDSDVELSVTDDGVGMPTDPAQVRTGLGTSIVQALAKQLDAELEIGAAHPGTRVVVAHTSIALLHNHAPTGLDTVSPAEQASATAVS
jgi:two-component sensor histidine kinase